MLNSNKTYIASIVNVYNNRQHIIVEEKLRRKLNKLSKKYSTYNMEPINTNEILFMVGNGLPFKLDIYKNIIKDQKKYSNLLFPIPTKVSVMIQHNDLYVRLEIRKEDKNGRGRRKTN